MSKEKNNNKGRKFDLLVSRRLINLSSTIVFVVVLLAIYFILTSILKTINLPNADMTQSKTYTLSQETKEAMKKIDKDINIYVLNMSQLFSNHFTGVGDVQNNATEIIKEFSKVNPKIHVSVIPDSSKNQTFASNYGIGNNSVPAVVIESGEEYRLILGIDMYNDYQDTDKIFDIEETNNIYSIVSFKNINLVEERVANSIISLTKESKKKVYIYTINARHDLSTDNLSFMNDLVTYGNNVDVVTDGNSVDVVTDGSIPDDCDLLVMPGLSSDLSIDQVDAIIEYIRKGKNIFILQSNDFDGTKYPNFQKVLEEYNLKIGEGIIFDETLDNNLLGSPDYLVEKTLASSITNGEDKNYYIFTINTAPIEYLENDDTVDYEVLCETSDKAFIRTNPYQYDTNGNVINERTSADGEYKKEVIGILANKKYDGKESKLILFASDEITVDVPVKMIKTQQFLSYMFQNKRFVINSTNYLLDNKDVISVEKLSTKPEFKGEESEYEALRIVVLIGASSVIVVGLIVWYIRRKRI